jgi:hypothetical protein
MNNNSSIKIYINSSKPYYYPGEEVAATILLDVLEKTNCNKMQIIAKGKQIVKALQKKYIESYAESEETNNSNESEEENESRRKRNKTEDSSEPNEYDNTSIARKLDESHKIFKYKKIVYMSSKNYMSQGKYSFPFEVTLPENIPGSFLFLEKNTYVEIIYSIKVKLNNNNLTEAIPIIVRQKEKLFNYPRSNEYTKSITGCCFDNNQSIIQLSSNERYTLSNKELKLNVVVNNKKCGIQASPISIELYQKIVVFPKNKKKKLKVTKLVGEYHGKSIVPARNSLNRDASFLIDFGEYASGHLKDTKSIKYFRHKDVIPFLCQSMKSEFVSCEYEAYAEVQFPNWSIEELGVFLQVLVYPPEKGILSKTVAQIATEFTNSIINKKVFLSSKTKEDDKDFGHKDKNKKGSQYKKNKYYENSESDEDNPNIRKSLVKAKGFGTSHHKEEDESNDKDNNDYLSNEKDNYGYNNNNVNNNVDKFNNKSEIINEDGSFGNRKGKNIPNVYIDTNSNNFKKDFSQNYLDDKLDDDFLDQDTNQ